MENDKSKKKTYAIIITFMISIILISYFVYNKNIVRKCSIYVIGFYGDDERVTNLIQYRDLCVDAGGPEYL